MTAPQPRLPAPIRLLPPSVAERIAAGEVIDRPAAVVRELIENAIDAGAAAVRIEARGGGLRLIRVADDGHGIPADEVELAVRRHATSKLHDLAGLEAVQTFGFRGEALASIAAVAELTLISETEGSPATQCSFRAGQPLERLTVARSRGTTVVVRDLFSTMPARLKFMRGARAEAAQIGALVRRYALARPDLRLTLVMEGHTSFQATAGTLAEALAAVYGAAAAGALLPLGPAEVAGARLHGLIGGHGATRSTRAGIALFVNGRFVRPRALLAAIERGYRPFLPHGRHTLGAIFIDLSPADVDVNIHPAKLDVRLREEDAVAAALAEAVQRAFGQRATSVSTGRDLALRGRQRVLPGLPRRVAEEAAGWGWGEGMHTPETDSLPALHLAGQLQDALIVAEGAAGLYLIDQHRAHERVIYERLRDRAQVEPQALIEPAVVRMPAADAERLAERLSALAALGFVCEPFGPDRLVLRAAPSGGDLDAIAGLAPEILREAAQSAEDWHERLLASLACRAALRKGRAITPAEAHDLITRLAQTRSPAVCPHGSPVLLHLSESFLARQFRWG